MAKDPTFRLLDGAWLGNSANALSRANVTIGLNGVKLAESIVPGTPLALDSSDGSLGRLSMPAGMAVDDQGVLYLLDPSSLVIKRFDSRSNRFLPLPAMGGAGNEPRRFANPTAIAIAAQNLYVADTGNGRVQVFALSNLALRFVWNLETASDVYSTGSSAYILDGKNGRVYRHVPGTDALNLVVESESDAGRWSRVIVDKQGRIYLYHHQKQQGTASSELSVFNPDGGFQRKITLAGDARDYFTPPPVLMNYLGLFQWAGLTFNRQGHPVTVDPTGPLGPRLYEGDGTWISKPIDSGIFRCPWHRIELQAEVPVGTRIVVSTHTGIAALGDNEISALPEAEWDTRFALVSGLQPQNKPAPPSEFLIQSSEGQFLWVRVELHGNGFATPAAQLLRVHFPRETYLDYLPGIFTADDEGRRFLERFLAVFKTEWDSLEQRLASMPAYFDPKAVPDGFIDWLAGWVALPLEQTWSADKKRRALETIPALYPRMGTPGAVQQYIRVYLENLGLKLPPGQPALLEGFHRRRQVVSLANTPLGRQGMGAPLWSRGVVSRLQIGEYSRVGEARIISTGSPDTDLFHTYAHRFELFVPAAAIKTDDHERMLRRAVDAAKPAHATYDLNLVAARFRVGVQSSVGLDTVIGAYPGMRLGCDVSNCRPGDRPAPSAPAQSRLGFDTVLGRTDDHNAGFRVSQQGARAGVDTILR
jgi:phage tail-like protein